MPAISVVVPTYLRPTIVNRAVASALGQDFDDIEVVVVVDGRDAATKQTLEAFGDRRVRPVVPERGLGNGGARNLGIAEARGEWIALLDDDDYWHPQKLARQLSLAERCVAAFPVVSCRFEAVGAARHVWPRRFPRPDQPISEYLFTRSGPRVEGAVQTSTFLVPRALFERTSFDPGLDRYVDLDWLLRAACLDGFTLLFDRGEPLSVYSVDDSRKRISNAPGWRRDVDWIRERSHLVTPRALGGFLLTQASIRAERTRDYAAFLPLLRAATTEGRISAGEVLFHTLNTFLPRSLRQAM